jgi:hypothetical protein
VRSTDRAGQRAASAFVVTTRTSSCTTRSRLTVTVPSGPSAQISPCPLHSGRRPRTPLPDRRCRGFGAWRAVSGHGPKRQVVSASARASTPRSPIGRAP